MSLKNNTLSLVRGPNGPKIYVETGSLAGDSIAAAIKAGFSTIHSIELSDLFYKRCVNRFKNNPNVHLHHGYSEKKLPKIISKITQQAVIFLDSHWSDGNTAKGENPVPLLLELDGLAKAPIKNHIIMIDDVRLFGTDDLNIWQEITLNKVLELLRKINKNYKFSYVDGYQPKDILVARI